MFLDPSAGCCARSLPSGFRHFQLESARKIRAHPHGKSASACVKSASFRATIRGCPRGTTTEFLRKKLSFPCHVPYNIHATNTAKGHWALHSQKYFPQKLWKRENCAPYGVYLYMAMVHLSFAIPLHTRKRAVKYT